MLYLAGAVAIVEGIGGLLERVSIADPAHTQLVFLAVGTAWTYTLLWVENRPLSSLPFIQRGKQIGGGFAFGVGAFLFVAVVASTGNWLQRAGGWGWKQWHPATLANSIATLVVTHAAYAWNEELVFRGYGYDVVRAAGGPYIAGVILTALFASYHQWRPQVLWVRLM